MMFRARGRLPLGLAVPFVFGGRRLRAVARRPEPGHLQHRGLHRAGRAPAWTWSSGTCSPSVPRPGTCGSLRATGSEPWIWTARCSSPPSGSASLVPQDQRLAPAQLGPQDPEEAGSSGSGPGAPGSARTSPAPDRPGRAARPPARRGTGRRRRRSGGPR